MNDISNRTLAILLITAIVVSLGASVYTINVLPGLTGITGRASTGSGNVTLAVSTTVSIVMNADEVDFGSGYVNTSKAGCADNATLRAGATYADSGGGDCWTASETPGPLVVENDGNRNITLTVTGPVVAAFFSSYPGSYEYNFSWQMRNNESGSCDEITAGADSYQPFDGTAQSICTNMDFEPSSSDEIAVDIEVKIPADLDPGTYENATITFTAAEAS